MVPPKHLEYIASIGKTECFDVSLTTGNVRGLGFVRAILSSMLRLKRVFQRMAMLKDGCYPTSAGRKDGRIGGSKVCAETGIPESALPWQW
jgi:hypothetical protein